MNADNSFSVREANHTDLAWILEMNNGAVPAVNALSEASLQVLSDQAESLLVAIDAADRPAGFLLLLAGPGADYESLNYRWFSRRYDRFLYIDRVVVGSSSRGNGLGSSLYEEAYRLGHGKFPVLCAEVNTRPRNEGSLRFHDRHGFQPVGEQDTEQGSKRVVLLCRKL